MTRGCQGFLLHSETATTAT